MIDPREDLELLRNKIMWEGLEYALSDYFSVEDFRNFPELQEAIIQYRLALRAAKQTILETMKKHGVPPEGLEDALA